jgi:hypothetical protein
LLRRLRQKMAKKMAFPIPLRTFEAWQPTILPSITKGMVVRAGIVDSHRLMDAMGADVPDGCIGAKQLLTQVT